jgi:hypothetical protein
MKQLLLFAILFFRLLPSIKAQCDNSALIWKGGGNSISGTSSNINSLGTCNNFDLNFKVNDTTRIVLKTDGRVFVGRRQILMNHPHANSFMQVDGKLACKELVVVDPTKWADFVFSPSYQLRSLNYLERYYTKHRHLPGVPTAKEVMSNGINIAEMDATLLQKIEELTLYLVALNKQVVELEKEVATLRTQAQEQK